MVFMASQSEIFISYLPVWPVKRAGSKLHLRLTDKQQHISPYGCTDQGNHLCFLIPGRHRQVYFQCYPTVIIQESRSNFHAFLKLYFNSEKTSSTVTESGFDEIFISPLQNIKLGVIIYVELDFIIRNCICCDRQNFICYC